MITFVTLRGKKNLTAKSTKVPIAPDSYRDGITKDTKFMKD